MITGVLSNEKGDQVRINDGECTIIPADVRQPVQHTVYSGADTSVHVALKYLTGKKDS